MEPISSFFAKFMKLHSPERAVRRALAQAIRDVVGVAISEEAITVRKDVAHLSVSSVVRSELILKKAELLDVANQLLRTHKVTLRDIR